MAKKTKKQPKKTKKRKSCAAVFPKTAPPAVRLGKGSRVRYQRRVFEVVGKVPQLGPWARYVDLCSIRGEEYRNGVRVDAVKLVP